MSTVTASGTFAIGGDMIVHRLGFGAMRITGPGIWGDPSDPSEARAVLAELPALGIDLIDTADSYGPYVSEDLIREVLHPYPGMVIATKGGLTRHGPNVWRPVGRPEYLRACLMMSLRRLRVDRIDLYQLHRIDPAVPADEQFGVLRDMQQEGLIRHVGLSQVSVAEVEAARKILPIATVQNLYHLAHRDTEDVLTYCETNGIGFIPWFPLAAGSLAKPGGLLDEIAAATGATHAQIALAWLLAKSPVMLPIPGTGRVAHLRENALGASVTLTHQQITALDVAGRQAWEASQAKA
jgi:pyridoxine 4-dehydrogenase